MRLEIRPDRDAIVRHVGDMWVAVALIVLLAVMAGRIDYFAYGIGAYLAVCVLLGSVRRTP